MGKRITQQARGRGGPAYKVRRKAFKYRVGYLPSNITGIGKVVKLVDSPGHSSPLAKVMIGQKTFYCPAAQGLFEGQEIKIGAESLNIGDIILLKNAPIGTRVFNIEKRPCDGGKMIRSGGGYATILRNDEAGVLIGMLNKNEVKLHPNCRATVGVAAGQGRVTKPIIKAGKMHKMMKSIGKTWHRTSPVKVNAVDHPWGGGRGKRIKSKIAKRDSSPGKKVGHLLPKKTGRKRGK